MNGDFHLLLGRASVRISRAVFIVKPITINGKFIQRMLKKRVRQHRKLFFSPSNSSSLSLSHCLSLYWAYFPGDALVRLPTEGKPAETTLSLSSSAHKGRPPVTSYHLPLERYSIRTRGSCREGSRPSAFTARLTSSLARTVPMRPLPLRSLRGGAAAAAGSGCSSDGAADAEMLEKRRFGEAARAARERLDGGLGCISDAGGAGGGGGDDDDGGGGGAFTA